MSGELGGGRISRALRPDAQAFDEIRIVTVPRYKTSGLSGDEWRISARVEFYRKGRLVHEDGCRNVETACSMIGYFHAKACADGKAYFAGEGDQCDQEGCAETATVTYRQLAQYCHSGHKTEGRNKIRRFCEKHKTRGDCALDDADSNYEKLS